MAKKIPVTNDRVEWTPSHVPLFQYGPFAEYREFMAAYFEARLWWFDEQKRPEAHPCLKFWFKDRASTTVLYGIMEAWMRGYWYSRSELRDHCSSIKDSAFARVLASASEAKYISVDVDEGDKRQKLIRPTRETIIMVEKFTTKYFNVIIENSHRVNKFTQGLRDRVNEIEELDGKRKKDVGWSIYEDFDK